MQALHSHEHLNDSKVVPTSLSKGHINIQTHTHSDTHRGTDTYTQKHIGNHTCKNGHIVVKWRRKTFKISEKGKLIKMQKKRQRERKV